MSRLHPTGVTELQKLHHSRRPGSNNVITTVIMVVMILVACYFLLPLVWLFVSTTKSGPDLFNTPMFGLSRHFAFFHNLDLVSTYQGSLFWRWYLNSAIYASCTAILSTAISALAGYALAKYQFRGQKAMLGMILSSLLIPGSALTIPVFLLIKWLGLMDSYTGVILPGLASAFGTYFMFIYIGGAMPNELIDSGRVDGANDWKIFLNIAVPIIRPALVTFFLISFIGSWNNFFLPLLILSNSKLFPLPLGLQVWASSMNQAGTGVPPYEQIITGSFLSVLPMLLLFPFLRKYISSGITTGGLKM